MRILSMDGGGILSQLTMILVRRINDARPGFLDRVEIFAGTSAGGTNSLFMASHENPAEGIQAALDLWGGKVPIYASTPVRKFGALIGQMALDSNLILGGFLRSQLGGLTLGDLPHRVVIPSFHLSGFVKGRPMWKAKIFHNFGGAEEPDRRELAADVGLRTTAFPVFFPVYQNYVDGGLFANNPSMCALTQALKAEDVEAPAALPSIRLLSIGTGQEPTCVRAGNADWGWGQWLLNPAHPMLFVEAVYDSPMLVVDQQCRQLMGPQRYFRLNPFLETSVQVTEEQSGDSPRMARIRAELIRVWETTDLGPVLAWLDASGWFEEPSETAAGELPAEQTHS